LTPDALAQLSDQLFTAAVVVYAAAALAFSAELAFGHTRAPRTDAALVTVGAPPAGSGAAVDPAAAPRRPGRRPWAAVGLGLAAVGVVLQVGMLAVRGWGTGRVPWGNMYEFGSAAVLMGMVAYLVVAARTPSMRHIGLFVVGPAALSLVLIGLFLYAEAGPLVAALRSDWLVVHVSAAIISFGVFLVSAVASCLFLVQRRRETRHTGSPRGRVLGRLPSARVLDRVAHRTAVFAFPVWTFAVIAGAIWAESAWGRFWGWDPKETWAFISWVSYAAYLHARSTAGWRGAPASWINLIGFASLVFNLLFVNLVSTGLHSYGGV
jgi:cytochrome c-type biogenesis protein CcsB